MKSKDDLLELLKQNDAKGIPFAATKQELLKLGHSEEEISHALYEANYDGRPNVKPEPHPATAHFSKHPELAEEVGKKILKEQRSNDRHKILAYFGAARFAPGRHAQSHYTFQLAESLGLPFFRIFLFGILIGVGIIFYGVPSVTIYIYYAIIILWGILKAIRSH